MVKNVLNNYTSRFEVSPRPTPQEGLSLVERYLGKVKAQKAYSQEVEVGGPNPPKAFLLFSISQSVTLYQAKLPSHLMHCGNLQYCEILQCLKDSPSPITKATLRQQILSLLV